MKTHLRSLTCLVIILIIGFGCKTFSKLLVKNGSEFLVQIETNENDKEAVLQQAIKITQNKLNSVGLDGEVIKDPDDPNRLIVRVYGSKDLERAKKFLFTTYQLELRKVISSPNPYPVTTYPTAEAAKQVAKGDQEVFAYLDHNSETENFVIVEKSVIVNGDDIRDAKARPRYDEPSENTISFTLKPQGATKFGDWTNRNINNYLAIILNRKVQSTAYIRTQIIDSGEINGRFTKEQAEDIAMGLKSGYLPATMKIVEEKQIGN